MIVNTNYTPHPLKAAISCLAVLLCLMAACTSTRWSGRTPGNAHNNGLMSNSRSESSNTPDLLSLSAAKSDYKSVSSRGSPVYWQPLLMPLRDKLTLSDRDFILGVPDKYGTIDANLPQNGQCILLNNQAQSQASNSNSEALIELKHSGASPQQAAEGTIFFIHDAGSRSVQGFGFLDSSGLARCRLPKGLWYISIGFGEARTHKILSTQVDNGTVQLQHHPRATLTIRPDRETKLRFGDIIRIGKLKPIAPLVQEDNGLPEVPLLVPDDLFRSVVTPSENSGVREYLMTSLLVHRQEFNLRLEPGQYYIGIWRKGEMFRCSARLLIQPEEESVLACDPDMESSRYAESAPVPLIPIPTEKSIKQIQFDATFIPARIIGNKFFRNWLAQGAVTDLMLSHGEVTNQLIGNTREDGLQKNLRFKLQPIMQTIGGELKADGPYTGDFRSRPTQNTEFQALSFVRLLSAQASIDADTLLSVVFSNENLWQTIPMAGTSERALLEGAVPFTFKTSIKSNRTGILRTDTAEVYATNGAAIEWINPSPPSAGLPMKLGAQQQIRVRLVVPPGNTTEQFALIVNGKRKKQWSIPKGQSSTSYRVLEIEEKNDEKSDFMIGFAAWSRTYLPEFMYGIKQLPALAFTRSYCVDVNENNICDKQWKSNDATSTYQP